MGGIINPLPTSIQWIGLEVMSASQGGAERQNRQGSNLRRVIIQDGEQAIHHERSRFRRSAGNWYYVDGVIEET